MLENKTTEKNIISGALILGISSIIVKILGLIYKIPLSYILSDEGMGYFNTAYTVYTFFYLICTAGVPKAISIMVSRSEAEGEPRKTNEIFRTALTIFLTLGLITTIVLILSSRVISDFIGNSNTYITIISIAPSIFFVCAAGVIRGYFNGKIAMLPIAVSESISSVAKLALGLILAIAGYRLGLDLYLISALTILGTTVGAFLGFLYLILYYKASDRVYILQKKKGSLFSKKIAKEIFLIAFPLTLTSIIASVSGLVDTVVIMRTLRDSGYSELQSSIIYGNYTTLVIPMLNLVGALIAPLSAVILPVITQKSVLSNRESISKLVAICTKIVSWFVFPVSALFIISPTDLLSMVFEDSSAVLAAPFLSLIAPGIIFMALLTVINTSLEGVGNVKIPLISLTIGSILKFIITYVLVGHSSLGVLGAPIGTSVSYFLSLLISFVVLTKKEKIKINIFDSTVMPMLLSAIAAIFFLAIKNRFYTGSMPNTIFLFIAFAVCYLILSSPFLIWGMKSGKILSKYTKKAN